MKILRHESGAVRLPPSAAVAGSRQLLREPRRCGRVKRIADLLADPVVKLHLLFVEFILAPLNEFNTTFQVNNQSRPVLMSQILFNITI